MEAALLPSGGSRGAKGETNVLAIAVDCARLPGWPIELNGLIVAKSAVQWMRVGEALKVGEQLGPRLVVRLDHSDQAEQLDLEGREDVLGHLVVVAVPDAAHRERHAVRVKVGLVYWLPWSESCLTPFGRRRRLATSSAATTNSAGIVSDTDQP
jgi:hypothetical protein